jgi:hypothetical protein
MRLLLVVGTVVRSVEIVGTVVGTVVTVVTVGLDWWLVVGTVDVTVTRVGTVATWMIGGLVTVSCPSSLALLVLSELDEDEEDDAG